MTDINEQVKQIVSEIENTAPKLYWDLMQRPSAILDNRVEEFLVDMQDARVIHGHNAEQLEAEEKEIADRFRNDLRRLAGYSDPEL